MENLIADTGRRTSRRQGMQASDFRKWKESRENGPCRPMASEKGKSRENGLVDCLTPEKETSRAEGLRARFSSILRGSDREE